MVYGELHIYPCQVLDQNANDNACRVPLNHEVWNVDHKRVMLGIDLYYSTFSHILVQHLHYPEYDYILEEIGRRDKIEFEREVNLYSDDMDD